MIALATLLLALPAQAQTPSNDTSVSSVRCERAQARLELRITRIETVQTNRSEAYSNIQARIEAIITAATASEYDTTDLLAAQSAVEAAVTEFNGALGEHAQTLTTASTLECGQTNSEFITTLRTARTSLSDVRAASLEIRTVIREQVLPAVQAYAASIDNPATREEQ